VERNFAPLADRMRPRTLDEFVGQEHLLGKDRFLNNLIKGDRLPSLILWGPPGCGKTSLANVIANSTGAQFVTLSAVTSGVKDVKDVVEHAKHNQQMFKNQTILFVDEIHRFNKLQQDAFLPFVESGVITLIGATTENPSFEVIGPLLSRCKVLVLKPLDTEAIENLLKSALIDKERGLGHLNITISIDELNRIARIADGDARFALSTLEIAVELYISGQNNISELDVRSSAYPEKIILSEDLLREALQEKAVRYDKAGEEHYDQISALHKAVRGSDPDGALYWLMRMLAGGEDPKYLARRLMRMAAEDIGLADPHALVLAASVRSAVEFIGIPECDVHLAELTVYLACAPKSNRIYLAVGAVRELIKEQGSLPIPMHLRNAPTKLMKNLGYGKNYDYQHDHPEGFSVQQYLPKEIDGRVFYQPLRRGFEEKLADKLSKLWPERYKKED
jgi:putative ATPase